MGKKLLSISFCLLFFLNCFNNIKLLNIITDDILLYELVDKFNKENRYIKVKLDYIKESEENIFDFVRKNNINNYDIIAGYYFPDVIIDSNNYSKIDLKLDKEIFNYVKESYKNNKYYIIYSIDFPIIITKKDKVKDIKDFQLDIDRFIELVRKNNVKKEKLYNSKIAFSPFLSNFSEIQYYFIFNSKLEKRGVKFYFDDENVRKAFNFYYNFDNNYNYGIEFTKRYLDKYKNIDKKFFIKKDIIYFDFKNFSESFNFDKENYQIYFIKNMEYSSLNKKVIAISNKSFLKGESLLFIKYLMENKNQKRMMDTSINLNFDKKHIAIYKDILKKYLNEDDLINYIDKLKEQRFYNSKIQKRFFEIFKNEFLGYQDISEEKFISYFFEKINK